MQMAKWFHTLWPLQNGENLIASELRVEWNGSEGQKNQMKTTNTKGEFRFYRWHIDNRQTYAHMHMPTHTNVHTHTHSHSHSHSDTHTHTLTNTRARSVDPCKSLSVPFKTHTKYGCFLPLATSYNKLNWQLSQFVDTTASKCTLLPTIMIGGYRFYAMASVYATMNSQRLKVKVPCPIENGNCKKTNCALCALPAARLVHTQTRKIDQQPNRNAANASDQKWIRGVHAICGVHTKFGGQDSEKIGNAITTNKNIFLAKMLNTYVSALQNKHTVSHDVFFVIGFFSLQFFRFFWFC